MSARLFVRITCDAPRCALAEVPIDVGYGSAREVKPPEGWRRADGYGASIFACPGDHADELENTERLIHADAGALVKAQNRAIRSHRKAHPDPKPRTGWLSRLRDP